MSTRFVVLPLVVLLFGLTLHGPPRGQSPAAAQGTVSDTQRPNPVGGNPKIEDAITAILAAYEKYEVVGMGAAHGNKDLDDFILGLIRNPALPKKVNDIAVECANSLYQPILDRYIAGDEVPLSEVRRVWRDTTQTMCGRSRFYEELFPLVRRVNQRLPPQNKLRVVAGDPAIDWSMVKSQRDTRLWDRDASIARVMKSEVLSKHRKALMLFGTLHLFHCCTGGRPSAVELYEKAYPGVTLVIADHQGFGNWTPLAKYNEEFEARMTSWPVPTLVQNMQGSWLADLLDMTYSPGVFEAKLIERPGGKEWQVSTMVSKAFSKMVDAYLYLGPRDLLLSEPPDDIALDEDCMAELQRRATLSGEEPIADRNHARKTPGDDSNPFLYDPDFLQRVIQDFCQSHPEHPCVIQQQVHVVDQ